MPVAAALDDVVTRFLERGGGYEIVMPKIETFSPSPCVKCYEAGPQTVYLELDGQRFVVEQLYRGEFVQFQAELMTAMMTALGIPGCITSDVRVTSDAIDEPHGGDCPQCQGTLRELQLLSTIEDYCDVCGFSRPKAG
jgi:hypothetical protein